LSLHSLPTRRSSDLLAAQPAAFTVAVSFTCSSNGLPCRSGLDYSRNWSHAVGCASAPLCRQSCDLAIPRDPPQILRVCRDQPCRSEEHTSELQSREN